MKVFRQQLLEREEGASDLSESEAISNRSNAMEIFKTKPKAYGSLDSNLGTTNQSFEVDSD